MKLSIVSERKFKNVLAYWRIQDEYSRPLCNYLIYGLNPGSFWVGVFANDMIDALLSSHPADTVSSLKEVARFIVNKMPRQAWGSHETVKSWIALSDQERRSILENADLIYTPEEETWEALRGNYE